jgi:hypothetical protein
MNQRVIKLYLARKGLSAVEIHSDLVAKVGSESASYLCLKSVFTMRYYRVSVPYDNLDGEISVNWNLHNLVCWICILDERTRIMSSFT